MRIQALIDQLEEQKKKHGNIEVTTTATYYKDGYSEKGILDDVWESTVESMAAVSKDKGEFGVKRLRLYWQC